MAAANTRANAAAEAAESAAGAATPAGTAQPPASAEPPPPPFVTRAFDGFELHGLEVKEKKEASGGAVSENRSVIAILAKASPTPEIKATATTKPIPSSLGRYYDSAQGIPKPVSIKSQREADEYFGTVEAEEKMTDGTIMRRSIDAILKQASIEIVCLGLPLPPTKSDIKFFKDIPAILDIVPEIFIAPVSTENGLPPQNQDFYTELFSVACSLRGLAICDLSFPRNTLTESEKTIFPQLGRSDVSGYAGYSSISFVWGLLPASVGIAGLIAKTDQEEGFWVSPSNKVLNSVTDLKTPVTWNISDKDSEANQFNSKGVSPFVRADGVRLWGNRMLNGRFISDYRVKKKIEKALERSFLWAVDKKITKGFIENVLEKVNVYMDSLKQREAILGGHCFVDPMANPKESIKIGKINFSFEYTNAPTAEHITFTLEINDSRLTEVLK